MKRLELLHNESNRVSLYDEERKQLRDSLLAYMDKVPVQPMEESLIIQKPSRMGLIMAIAAALLVGGAGISYAAEHSLPGDALYPVKVGVNEKVKGFFAFSDEKQASFEATLVAERLEEAEKLHAEARLDASTQETLRVHFNNHKEAYETKLNSVKNTNADAASKIDASFKSSLKAHATILPTLSITPAVEASTTIDSSVKGAATSTRVINDIEVQTTSLIDSTVSNASTLVTATTTQNSHGEGEVPTVIPKVKSMLQ
jgi:hypothetical protein